MKSKVHRTKQGGREEQLENFNWLPTCQDNLELRLCKPFDVQCAAETAQSVLRASPEDECQWKRIGLPLGRARAHVCVYMCARARVCVCVCV